MIDLHTHTNESDGTYTPAELIQSALEGQLDALAITDHDTFTGYDLAAPVSRANGFDLICGIELSTRLALSRGGAKTVHLLGYFLCEPPSLAFREWLSEQQAERKSRNIKLIANLRTAGVDIELAEVEGMGRSLAGRPHFAKILVQKGYSASTDHAFRDYLGETAPGFVERESPQIAFAIQTVIAGGGIPVVAHPVRLGFRDHGDEEAAIEDMRDAGLQGIEAYHSDHSPADCARYLQLAKKYGLAVTGGSDFHGGNKPRIGLGTGIDGNVSVPKYVLDNFRKLCG